MRLIITLYACDACPPWCHKFRYSAADVVRALHELLYPGTNEHSFPSSLTDIAKAYMHSDANVTKHVYSLGSDIKRYDITGLEPGVVKVYEKENNYDRVAS